MSFFRAITASTQAMPNNVETELVFGTELSDPDNVFSSNRFTVPAGWNGKLGGLHIGYGNPDSRIGGDRGLILQRQVGGSGGFSEVARISLREGFTSQLNHYPIIFSTGDVYRAMYFGASATKGNSPVNFFSGWVKTTETAVAYARAQINPGLSIGTSGIQPVPLNVVIRDTHLIYSATGNSFIVPGQFNGGIIQLVGSLWTGYTAGAYVQVSTDNGATWQNVAGQSLYWNFGSWSSVDTGPIAAVTGHRYRLAGEIYAYGGVSANTDNGPHTSLSAIIRK